MRCSFQKTLIGAIALAQLAFAADQLHAQRADLRSPSEAATASTGLGSMPPLPSGESTILGGSIRHIDPVLDQFTLDIFGERPMTIQFDPRTKVYRNGVEIALSELGAADHASVQTALDGTHVYAESIHILTRTPEGECQGLVQSFDPGSGKLTIASQLSPTPVEVQVPGNTPIARVGQPEFVSMGSGIPDLIPGALVTVTFAPGSKGRVIARQISVLAVPGARFIFSGNVSALNISTGSLVLVDARDGKSYQIYFSHDLPSISNLQVGDDVRITTSFERARYVASEITIH